MIAPIAIIVGSLILLAVPQLLTRDNWGQKILDFRPGQDAWFNRGIRFTALGLLIVGATLFYFERKAQG